MDSKLKVTDVPEEANFYDLVAGDNVLEIPLFQRPYMWKESHYKALLQDISLIDEETNGAVFLGVIVSFGRGSGPGVYGSRTRVPGMEPDIVCRRRLMLEIRMILSFVPQSRRGGSLECQVQCQSHYREPPP
ncbi:hypothetical protein CO652_13535 [Rhizobium sp. H4]|nr:hypothetical protein CO652_13535 [Rhizobium sp. H4]